MAGRQSTSATAVRKPYPDFPLTPRKDGRWCKKIRGKLFIFSGTADEALKRYRHDVEYIMRGEVPPDPDAPGELTVRDLCNHFLEYKDHLVQTGELTRQSFSDYTRTARKLVDFFGKTRTVTSLQQSNFADLRVAFAKTQGPVGIGNDVRRTRMIFKFGFDQGLCPAVKYGQAFRPPSPKTIRKAQAETNRTLAASEIHTLLENASPQLRGMILLGVNCGLGNSDVGQLRHDHIRGEWLDYARPKTGIPRRSKLWMETREAIGAVRKEGVQLVFLTKRGKAWHKDASENPVSAEFRKLLRRCGLYRKGETGFYSLRHTFAQVARQIGDDEATKVVLGHVDPSMLSRHYTEQFPDARLERVADHVHAWLFDGGRKPR